jgi:hypothetical protein
MADLVTALNLVLCLAIVIVGYLAYKKSGNPSPLYVALAFLLFGISHAVTLSGMAEQLSAVLVAIRILAYATVLFAVYTMIGAKKKK